MAGGEHPGVLLFVRFKSALAPAELERRYRERMSEFQELPGLLQKYYVYDKASGEWGGVYLWDSQAALESYMASDLRRSISEAYEVVGTPRVEAVGVIDVLRRG
jgi:heme-degrading monooxygenase HmoA